MKDGIYHVTFNTPMGSGQGVVVVANSAVNGGDDGYTYQGRVTAAGDRVSGLLTVSRHSAGATSVFGDFGDFTLSLDGVHSARGFQVAGITEALPGVKIQITGRWLRALAP